MKQIPKINSDHVRTVAVQVECLATAINRQTGTLQKKFDELYGYLQFTDPKNDASLDRFLLTLARAKSLCDVLPSLIYQAQALQKFGLPTVPATALSGAAPCRETIVSPIQLTA